MKERDGARIRKIKSEIVGMLAERQSLEQSVRTAEKSLVHPSELWSASCSSFDYLLGLREESFEKLRLHTYHLTGDNYQTYRFGDPGQFRQVSNIDGLTDGIPPEYVLNEPSGGIGFRYDDGRFLSGDIARFQRVVSTLYRHGLLHDLSKPGGRRRHLLEIGGGYGGLVHHLSRVCPNLTCVIVDLPETLLFSASYLTLLNPEKRIYLYDRGSYRRIMRPDVMDKYDFVLIPNYRLQSMRGVQFDVAANIASFQEMRTSQVEEYLDFVRKTCTGALYSCNQDRYPWNAELSNLTELLARRFLLTEVPDAPQERLGPTSSRRRIGKMLRRAAVVSGLLDRPVIPVTQRYREYVCRPTPEHGNKLVTLV